MEAFKNAKLFVLLLLIVVCAALWSSRQSNWFMQYRAYLPFVESRLEIDFDEPLQALEEADVVKRYRHLSMTCNDEPGNLGERVCWAYPTRLNGMPVKMAAFFFTGNVLSFIRFEYPQRSHQAVWSRLKSKYLRVPSCGERKNLDIWVSGSGLLAIQRTPSPKGNHPIITWQPHKDEARKKAAVRLALMNFLLEKNNLNNEEISCLKNRESKSANS